MEEQKRRRERKSAAYWLSKSSILYPICILYVMYVKQVEVYITECSVHISSGTMLFAYALCLILWLASPIRSYCADGTANEVLFYAFPPITQRLSEEPSKFNVSGDALQDIGEHLQEVDKAAREREEIILKQLEEKDPLPDKEKIRWHG